MPASQPLSLPFLNKREVTSEQANISLESLPHNDTPHSGKLGVEFRFEFLAEQGGYRKQVVDVLGGY